jgi:hypothetical protein
LWYALRESKPKLFSAFCVQPKALSERILHRTCGSLGCNNFVENSARNLWKFTRNLWNCEVPSFTHFFWPTLWTRPSLTTNGQPLCSSSWTSVRPFLSYSSFTHYILAINCE